MTHAPAIVAQIVLWLVVASTTAAAHDLGAARVRLEQLAEARYVLVAEVPPELAPSFAPPVLPERCRLEAEPGRARAGTTTLRYPFACADEPLTARDVLELPWPRQGAMVSASWLDGTTARQFFAQTGNTIEVPLAALQAGSGSLADAARRYTALGIEHILLGIDHLLFVFGLLLLVRSGWMLVKTITAFTLAHSITLALATLGVVHVPSRPVDAAIALSIVFLAAEILHARQGRIHLTARMPWVVAFVFGLLHGLGFAGALSELGLAPGEIPVALLFFNVGVELGQLAFVAVVLLLRAAWQLLGLVWPRWVEPLPAYAIGTLAALWLLERTSAMFMLS